MYIIPEFFLFEVKEYFLYHKPNCPARRMNAQATGRFGLAILKIKILNSPNFTSLKRAMEHISRGRAKWADPEHKSILFTEVGRQISAVPITTNDADWKSAITPNPWRGLKSGHGGPTVMQIDKRPGLCRKDES